eukprot:1158037-Pelagomonas_calceolata.AAC.5
MFASGFLCVKGDCEASGSSTGVLKFCTFKTRSAQNLVSSGSQVETEGANADLNCLHNLGGLEALEHR